MNEVAGKHPSSALFSWSLPDTSCVAEAGCWAGSSLWPPVAVFVYDLEVSHFISSQNCLAHIRASLFLADVSSCHAEILPPTLLCLHRVFRRSGTSSLRGVLSFPPNNKKDAIWLGIRASIFCSTSVFLAGTLFFADNPSFGQNLSLTLRGLIDDFLELVLQGSLLNAASSRDSAKAIWVCKWIAYAGSSGAAVC